MGIPIQEILELIFVGALALTVGLVLVVLITGGKHPKIGRPVAQFLFRARALPWRSGGGIIDTGSQQFDGFFRGLVALSLIYSVGISVDRISDALREEPGEIEVAWRDVPFFGRTDNSIRAEVFDSTFAKLWPDEDPSCVPYDGRLIDQTYYTANNYLMGKSEFNESFRNLKKRIHYSEAISILGFVGSVLLSIIVIVFSLMAVIYAIVDVRRIRGSHAGSNANGSAGGNAACRFLSRLCRPGTARVDSPNWIWVDSWPFLRVGRAIFLLVGMGLMTVIASYAWSLDEKSYDQRVFGYYLTELQLSQRGTALGVSLPRTVPLHTEVCESEGKLLVGLPDVRRFDASGVAWAVIPGMGDNEQARHFLVANDKDRRLTLHDETGRLVAILDLGKEMRAEIARRRGLRSKTEAELPNEVWDLEALSPIGEGRYLLLGSHSTKEQKPQYERRHAFEVLLTGSRDVSGSTVLDGEVAATDINVEKLLEQAVLPDLDVGNRRNLSTGWQEPERDCCDVNLEGVAEGPVTAQSGEVISMRLFALREPLFCEDDKPVSRIYGAVEPGGGLEPVVSVPAMLPNAAVPGPHRLSDIAYDRTLQAYWLLTSVERADEEGRDRVMAPCSIRLLGSRALPKGGALWRWNGKQASAPELVGVTAFHKPEGIAVRADGTLVIVYDDDADAPACGAIPMAPFSIGQSFPQRPLMPGCGALLPAPKSG